MKRVRGTRKRIIDRRLNGLGDIVRVLECGHVQLETRGGLAKVEACANCKQCRRAFELREALKFTPSFES